MRHAISTVPGVGYTFILLTTLFWRLPAGTGLPLLVLLFIGGCFCWCYHRWWFTTGYTHSVSTVCFWSDAGILLPLCCLLRRLLLDGNWFILLITFILFSSCDICIYLEVLYTWLLFLKLLRVVTLLETDVCILYSGLFLCAVDIFFYKYIAGG
jgi:hypothetical protein